MERSKRRSIEHKRVSQKLKETRRIRNAPKQPISFDRTLPKRSGKVNAPGRKTCGGMMQKRSTVRVMA